MKINASLGNLKKVIDELNKYKEELERKRIEFLNRLSDAGIEMAESQLGEFAGMVVFRKEIDENGAIIVATDKEVVIKSWYTDKKLTNERHYEISPLLLAEFGSGFYATVLQDIEGVGQGTMPGQRHAFDTKGWWWYEADGTKHHSYGEPPKMPMYLATLEMETQIQKIAREVFG